MFLIIPLKIPLGKILCDQKFLNRHDSFASIGFPLAVTNGFIFNIQFLLAKIDWMLSVGCSMLVVVILLSR